MAERILGPQGSKRRRRFLWVPMLVIAATALFLIASAQAVHDTGVFQLDGDATTSLNTTGAPAATDDWDKVCHQVTVTNDTSSSIPDQCTSVGDTASATAVAWSSDNLLSTGLPSQNASIFTGGGSKDPQDIDQWAWKDGSGGLPDKDNLQHAFAVRYSVNPTLPNAANPCPNGTGGAGQPAFDATKKCELLFFGSDRFDNSGDAQQGFWLLQNRITLGTNSVGGGQGFSGVHKTGDLLIISDFSNGGTTSTITVYSWDPSVSGNLKQLETSDNAKCTTVGGADAFCGIVNPSTVSAPWSFTDKSNTPSNGYLNGELYEGGINLSLLPAGFSSECFSSLESETRSSTSTTATLKDFVLTNFGDCTVKLSTQVDSASVNYGTAEHDTITVTGSQSSLTPSGSVEFFLCSFGTSDTTSLCDGTTGKTGTSLGSSTLSGSGKVATATSPATSSTLAPGRYCFRAEWPGDANYKPTSPATKFTEYGQTAGSNECFTVSKIPSSVTTQVHNASHANITNTSVVQGTTIHDNASVTGSGPTPTGTVTFTIYGSIDCTGSALTGTGVPTNPETGVSLNSSGVAESTAWTPAAGQYSYKASYGGDTIYSPASDSACEPITIINPSTTFSKSASPSVSTTVTYNFSETNDGSVPLNEPTAGSRTSLVQDNQCSTVTYLSGDSTTTGTAHVLDPGETWLFRCSKTYTGTRTFSNAATGHGIDPVGKDVTYCADPTAPPTGVRCDQDEHDTTSVVVSVTVGK
jgi:hypothetical protein